MIKSNLMSKAVAAAITSDDWLYVVLGDTTANNRDRRITFSNLEKSILGEGSITLTELKNDDMFYIVKTSENNKRTKVNVGTIIEKVIAKYDTNDKTFGDEDTIIVVDKNLTNNKRFQIKIGELRKSFEDGIKDAHFKSLAVGFDDDALYKFFQVDSLGNVTISDPRKTTFEELNLHPYMKFTREGGIEENVLEIYKGDFIVRSGDTTDSTNGFFQANSNNTDNTSTYLYNFVNKGENSYLETSIISDINGISIVETDTIADYTNGNYIIKANSTINPYMLKFYRYDILNTNTMIDNSFIINNTPKLISISVGADRPLRYKGEYVAVNGLSINAGDVVYWLGAYRCARKSFTINGSATLPSSNADANWYGKDQFVYFQNPNAKFSVDHFGVIKLDNFTIDNYKSSKEFSIIDLESTDNFEGYLISDWNSVPVYGYFYKYNIFYYNNSYWQSTNTIVGLYGPIQKLPSTPAPGSGSGVWTQINVANKKSLVVTKTDIRTGMKFTSIEGLPFNNETHTSGFASTLSPRSLEIISGAGRLGNFSLTKITSDIIEMKNFINNTTVENRGSGVLKIARNLIKMESEGDFYGNGGTSYHIASKDEVIDGKKYNKGFVARTGVYGGAFGETSLNTSGIELREFLDGGNTFKMRSALTYNGFKLYNPTGPVAEISNRYGCGNFEVLNPDNMSFGEFGGDEWAGGYISLSTKDTSEDFSRKFFDIRTYTISDNTANSGMALKMFGGMGTNSTEALFPYKKGSTLYPTNTIVYGYDPTSREDRYAIATTNINSHSTEFDESGWRVIDIVQYRTNFEGAGIDGQVGVGEYGDSSIKYFIYNGKIYRAKLPTGQTYGAYNSTYNVYNEWWCLSNHPSETATLNWYTDPKWVITGYPVITLTTRKHDVLTGCTYNSDSEREVNSGGNGIFKIYASNSGGASSKQLAFSINKNTIALYDYNRTTDGYRQNLVTISGMDRVGTTSLEGETSSMDRNIHAGLCVYSKDREDHVAFKVPIHDKNAIGSLPVVELYPRIYSWNAHMNGGSTNLDSIALRVKQYHTDNALGGGGVNNVDFSVSNFVNLKSVSDMEIDGVNFYNRTDHFEEIVSVGKSFSNIDGFRCNIRTNLNQKYFQMELDFIGSGNINSFLEAANGHGSLIKLMRFKQHTHIINSKTNNTILGRWAVLDRLNHSGSYGQGANISGVAVMGNNGDIILTSSSFYNGFPGNATLVVQFNT